MTEPLRSLSEVEGPPIAEDDLILYNRLQQSALIHADQLALISLHQPNDLLSPCFPKRAGTCFETAYIRWTYADIWHLSGLLAGALLARGFRRGKTLSVLLYNQAEWTIAWWSAIRIGAVFAPMFPDPMKNTTEFKQQIRIAQPEALIVSDTDVADSVDSLELEAIASAKLKIVADLKSATHGEWFALGEVLQKSQCDVMLPDHEYSATDVTTCFFSGGTTSLPKPTPRTSQMDTLGILFHARRHHLGPGRRVVGHLPSFHSYGSRGWMAAWTHGGCVVFPARIFSPTATIEAIEKENCSYMPVSPSMIDSLVNYPDVDRRSLQSLDTVILSGSLVHPDLVTTVMAPPFCAKHATGSFGMSEVGLIAEWDLDEIQPRYTNAISVGKILPGMKWRICYPDTQEIVPHGEPGELHVGSSFMYHGFAARNEDWLYIEGPIKWVRTGDRACLGKHNELYILGRYKDLISRGGKDISPALIESVFFKNGIKAEVIGMPDDIAGEVPVAIIDSLEDVAISEDEMQHMVSNALGRLYVPQKILTLQDLQLQRFPRTVAGKPNKKLLIEIAKQFYDQIAPPLAENSLTRQNGHQESTTESVRQIWMRLGAPKSLSIIASVTDFADSLVILQAVNLMGKTFNKAVTPDEILANPTVEQQASILDRRSPKSDLSHVALFQRVGPPVPAEIAHVQNNELKYQRTQMVTDPAIARLGLTWDDVEDIFPVCDNGRFMLETACRLQSWNQRLAFKADVLVDVMQQALYDTLKLHPMFRSIAVKYDEDTWLHVILRASPKWFSKLVTIENPIASESDLRTYRFNDHDFDHASNAGPLFKISIIPLRDEEAVGVLVNENHSTFDALSSSMWLEDLNLHLTGRWEHRTHLFPFKHFAEAFYFGRHGTLSRANCGFFAKKLQDCSLDKRAQWPQQKVENWVLGLPVGYKSSEHSPPELAPRSLQLQSRPGQHGLKVLLELPDDIHSKLGFNAVTIFTASIAMLNVHKTGADYALFSHWEAARTWPFQEKNFAYQSMLPSPMDVAGPTGQRVVDKIYVSKKQKVEDLLMAIETDIRLTSQHAHAPLFEIKRMLAESKTAVDPHEDAEVFMSALQRQVLDWIPNVQAMGSQNPRAARRVQYICRSDIGLDWTGSRIDRKTVALSVCWDDAQLEEEEMRRIFNEVALSMELLAESSNLSMSISDIWEACDNKTLEDKLVGIAQE